MVEQVEICVVTRTYQGLEGMRVKAGTRFAVGKEKAGLPTITKTRYQNLLTGKLVRPFGEQDTKAAAKYARPLERRQILHAQPQGTPGAEALKVRTAARRRIKQSESPEAPKQLKGPQHGSQTGPATSASSSPAAPASAKSTSESSSDQKPKRPGGRGNRGAAPSSASSPSITPTR